MWQSILATGLLVAGMVLYMILGVLAINWVRRNCKDTGYYDILMPFMVILMPMQAFMILFKLNTEWFYDQEKRNF